MEEKDHSSKVKNSAERGSGSHREVKTGLEEVQNTQEYVSDPQDRVEDTDEAVEDTNAVVETPVTDSEWERRTLCSDESCIGVVGLDGRCKECGLPYPGWRKQPGTDADLPADASSEAEPEETQPAGEDAKKAAEAEKKHEFESQDPDLDWEKRTLCRDESCIGVIGPDGRCKECGLPYEQS